MCPQRAQLPPTCGIFFSIFVFFYFSRKTKKTLSSRLIRHKLLFYLLIKSVYEAQLFIPLDFNVGTYTIFILFFNFKENHRVKRYNNCESVLFSIFF